MLRLGRADRPEPDGEVLTFEGKVASLLYDCFGNFEGFVLDNCGARTTIRSCERAVEEVIRRACRERSKVTARVRGGARGRLLRLAVHCC